MVSKVLFSHKSDEYVTPKWLMDDLKKEFDIRLDACTTEDNPLQTDKFYTKKEDGLTKRWETWTYCNPPYSQISEWVWKAWKETESDVKSILLLPARTDTQWFHYYIYKRYKIRFIKGRLKFEGTKNSAPFPSMIVIFQNQYSSWK